MKFLTVLSFLFVFCIIQPSQAQEYNDVAFFDFNQNMRTAHEHAIQLRLKDCGLILQTEKSKNPMNLIPYYIDDVMDFMRVYVNENYNEFKKLQTQRDIRLAKLKSGDNASPYYLYCQAAVATHWALLHIRFDEYAEATKLIKLALPNTEQNLRLNPDFVASKMVRGAAIALGAAISNDTKTGLTLNISEGLNLIKEACDYGKKIPKWEFNELCQLWLTFSLVEIGIEESGSWAALNPTILDYKKSPMAAYVLAVYNLESGNSIKALAALEAYPTDDRYHSFYFLDYMRGLCYLYKLDNKADMFIKKYLDRYQGVHHIKDAYQKMAWSSLLKNNTQQYKIYMADLKQKGNAVAPYDVNAEREANLNLSPNINLLKAHLLFEGGFYDKAAAEIALCNLSNFKTDYEKAEFGFYKGRIEHKMKRLDAALREYDAVINTYKSKSFYFACAASFFAGTVWEERKEYDRARQYYENSSKMNPEVFKKTLHDRARTRLDAIKMLKTDPNATKNKVGATIGGPNKKQ
jgi:hypothetical protein